MSIFASALLLLQLSTALITNVNANPNVTEEQRKYVVEFSNKAISIALSAIAEAQLSTSTIVEPPQNNNPGTGANFQNTQNQVVVINQNPPTVDLSVPTSKKAVVTLQAQVGDKIIKGDNAESNRASIRVHEPLPYSTGPILLSVSDWKPLRILVNVNNADNNDPPFDCVKSGNPYWSGPVTPRDHWEENVFPNEVKQVKSSLDAGQDSVPFSFAVTCTNKDGTKSTDNLTVKIVQDPAVKDLTELRCESLSGRSSLVFSLSLNCTSFVDQVKVNSIKLLVTKDSHLTVRSQNGSVLLDRDIDGTSYAQEVLVTLGNPAHIDRSTPIKVISADLTALSTTIADIRVGEIGFSVGGVQR